MGFTGGITAEKSRTDLRFTAASNPGPSGKGCAASGPAGTLPARPVVLTLQHARHHLTRWDTSSHTFIVCVRVFVCVHVRSMTREMKCILSVQFTRFETQQGTYERWITGWNWRPGLPERAPAAEWASSLAWAQKPEKHVTSWGHNYKMQSQVFCQANQYQIFTQAKKQIPYFPDF